MSPKISKHSLSSDRDPNPSLATELLETPLLKVRKTRKWNRRENQPLSPLPGRFATPRQGSGIENRKPARLKPVDPLSVSQSCERSLDLHTPVTSPHFIGSSREVSTYDDKGVHDSHPDQAVSSQGSTNFELAPRQVSFESSFDVDLIHAGFPEAISSGDFLSLAYVV